MFLTFMNNDDWVYYKMVQNFLNGNFTLDSISAPTFYTQGFLGFLFSKFFGLSNLPILTILISLLSFGVFGFILYKFFGLSKKLSFFFSLFLLINPYFAYSSIGFMTENYFLFFILLALFFFYKFENSGNKLDLGGLFLTLFAGFMLRQVTMVFPIALGAYYLLKRKYKLSLASFSFFALLYSFYTFIFPQTAEMHEKPLQFHNLLKFDYSYALIYGSLLVLVAVLFPLILSFVVSGLKKVSKTKIILLVVLTFGLFYGLNHIFKPMTLSWGEFPYLENTWERTGLYPRGIVGTKYQFKYNFDLYHYWDLGSKILLSVFISYIVVLFKKKNLIDFNLIFVVLYFGLMLLSETFYDRYLLVVVPFILLFLIKNIDISKFNLLLNFGFILFLSFYTYQFTTDFVLVNKYIWDKSNDLVVTQTANPSDIHGTNPWKLVYPNVSRGYLYKFSYDSPEVNEGYRTGYTVEEIKVINYPLNFFIEPKIYLYKKKVIL